MSRAPVTSEERYGQLVKAFLQNPKVTQEGRGFGSSALKVGGKMFATLSSQGFLVVKLSRQRVDQLVAAGVGRPFEPGPGRVMKEWLEVRSTSGQNWTTLAKEAMSFVSGASAVKGANRRMSGH
jgi:hypothetical protein